jgi:hypothetical protein
MLRNKSKAYQGQKFSYRKLKKPGSFKKEEEEEEKEEEE